MISVLLTETDMRALKLSLITRLRAVRSREKTQENPMNSNA